MQENNSPKAQATERLLKRMKFMFLLKERKVQ